MMAVARLQDGMARPGEQDIVYGGIEDTLDEGRVVVLGDDCRLMAIGLIPIVGIIGMFASGVGET